MGWHKVLDHTIESCETKIGDSAVTVAKINIDEYLGYDLHQELNFIVETVPEEPEIPVGEEAQNDNRLVAIGTDLYIYKAE